MSTHTKFNPEGVKGRTAQPPHNFSKIMTQYHINRSTETPKGSYTETRKHFDSLQEAMDELYRMAKAKGLAVVVDNTPDGSWGFCLWQIYFMAGKWRYYVTEETEESLELMGF